MAGSVESSVSEMRLYHPRARDQVNTGRTEAVPQSRASSEKIIGIWQLRVPG